MRGKKLLSLIISITMTLSMFSGLTMTSAQAAVGDPANNVWTASAADKDVLADTVLVDDEKGTLTTLFDFTLTTETTDDAGVTTPISETVGDRTFSAYVSHPTQNGGFNSDGTLRSGYTTLLSYVPKADGVITAYFLNVASNKSVCIVEDGAQNFKAGGSLVYKSGIDASMSVSTELKAGKTYYMFVDGSKGRFAAVDFEVGATYVPATEAPATPPPTLDPNAKVYEWTVSDADINKKAGDLLMTGLSLVSDNAGTNKYVTALDNGDLVGGVATGSALQFVAPENGTISVTFKDLGNENSIKTAHIYDATAGKEVASYTTQGAGKETFDLSAGVSEGSTYYIYANGTRARYSAAKFTPGEAPKDYSWTVSESDIGKVAGTALMEGLTLVADNSSESDKYVTALDNGKIEKDEEGVASVTGAALKFVAPEDGTLEVTMIDVGSENEDGTIKVVNPVIYDYESGNDVFSYENTAAKETVVLSAEVEAGKTYYAIATGTKGRFSAAKFTPASSAVATEAPATDAPAKTDAPATQAPAVEAIAYADGTVTVTLADVETAVLINASYADGVLSSVNTYDLTFTNGVATQAVEAAEGSKLMVWDCLECMKPLCASYTVSAKVDETTAPVVTDTPATTAPVETENPSNLPADVIFRADDAAYDSLFATTPTVETTVNGLTVSAGFGVNTKKVSYTHNGVDYQFTRQWKHGNSAQTLTFTPATSCVVTVVFNGNGGVDRKVTISQGGTELAAGLSTDASTSAAETVVADVLDAKAGDVVIGGGGSNKNISAIFVEYYDATPDKAVTGKITNSTGEDMSAETIVFTNTADATDVVEMAYAENYSVNLTKGATYAISVKGKEDTICPTISTAEITVTKNRNELTHDFELVKIGDVTVTGNVYTLASHDLRTPAKAYDSSIGATLNFTKEGDTTPVTATVNADGTYSVSLPSNENYTVALANAEGYTLSTLSASYSLPGGVVNPTKNVLIMKDVADSVEYKATVTVGADKDYPTVSDAVAAIRKMSRQATERVEIVVDPGTYTEQVYLDVNNVTLKSADASNPALISWYYGIGYEYYSAAKDGWYNADAAVAKTSKGTAQKWGGTVYVRGSGFLAENIKFQSSFNLEIVPQELADGVAPGGGDAKNWDRTAAGADPKSRAAVERAAAMLVEGANAEFYKCSFQSSQDTLWTGSSAAYFKECDIYGGTDYIFGGNSVVFDTCNLIWQGYSDQQVGGYITACKNSSTEDNGYLMLNCTVKNNTADSGQQFAQGGYGRNWGGVNCKVIFLNTKLEGDAKVAGWTKMGGELAQSNLYVANTMDKDGNAVTLTSADLPCGELSAEDIAAIDPYDYFNDWTPVHYEGEVPENTTIASINLADGSLFSEDEKTNKTQVSFGVDASGNRVAADSEDAVVVFTDVKYWNDHGINPGSGSISVKVTGPTEIAVGACTYGSDVTVKNGDEVIKVLKNGIGCGSRDASKKLVTYYKGTEPTTITISGGGYIPFVTFKGVELSDIPNDYTVTFDKGSEATGVVPSDIKAEIGESFTIPVNRSLYVEGKTLTGWTDGTKTYSVGATVEDIATDTTLTPVFTENTVKLGDAATSATFYFGESNGAAQIAIQGASNPTAIVVAQATIDDKVIDVKLDADATAGKLNNMGRGDTWAQINSGTILNVPALAGSVVGMEFYSDSSYTYKGETVTAGTTFEVTVAESGNAAFTILAGGYISKVTVTYPAVSIEEPVETEKPVETTDPTVAPTDPTETTAPVETEEPAETTAPVETTAPTEAPTFVANDKVVDGYNVAQATTDGETVYTFTKTAGVGVDGAGYSFDISELLGENKYSDKGTMTVSMQFMMPDADNKPSGDGYIDISSSPAYQYGEDTNRFARYNIYNGWDQFNYYGPSTTRINGGLKFSDHEGEWYTLTMTADITTKSTSVVTTVGSNSATYGPFDAFPSTLTDGKLYINVMPTRAGNDANKIEFSIKNITVSYEEAPDVIPANVTAVNGTNDLKTTKLGGEVAVDKATANVGDTVTVTPTAYYGFEVSAVNVEKVTESGSETVVLTANDGVYSFVAEEGVTDYNVSATFAQDANTKILYFADSTVGVARIGMDKDLKVMNYVVAGTTATWAAESLKLYGKTPKGMKIVTTRNGDPAVTLSLNGTQVGTATQALSLENEFKAATTSYFTADVDLTGITFSDSDALGISISSPSGSTGFLGNYWYVVIEYQSGNTDYVPV